MKILAVIGATLALLFSGCASYQMGETVKLPYKAIAVTPPLNTSNLPQLEGPLNAALRQEILQSGALELARQGNQDATLSITVLEARREIAAVTADDVGRGRKFELVIDFELALQGNGDAYIPSRIYTIKQDIFTESGLVDAEHQATPIIARLAAQRAIEIITDLW